MQLLVIRHGVAEDKDAFAKTGKDDSLRPLTRSGKREMAGAAAGLRVVAREIAVLASSPLVRAQQTAAIVAREYGIEDVAEVDALDPDADPEQMLPWLREQSDDGDAGGVVAVVGHEPHLSCFVSWLLTGDAESRVVLRKGGACLLKFVDAPAAGGARLHWLMTPAQLRRLAARER